MECRQCLAEFVQTRNKVYCSSNCRSLYWYHKHNGARLKEYTCIQCGETFQHKFKNVRFCSRKCGLKNSRDSRREEFRKQEREYYHKNRDKKLEEQRKYRETSGLNDKRTKSGHSAYHGMKARCNNPNHNAYRYYGARGVQCLFSFVEFQKIYFRTNLCELCACELDDTNRKFGKKSRTIDRIDSNKHYCHNNVRIICRSCNTEQMNESKKT